MGDLCSLELALKKVKKNCLEGKRILRNFPKPLSLEAPLSYSWELEELVKPLSLK
ncbi:MAG: hypothetical protein QXX95_07415 [Nitrososphaerales archaeon]